MAKVEKFNSFMSVSWVCFTKVADEHNNSFTGNFSTEIKLNELSVNDFMSWPRSKLGFEFKTF